MGTVSTRCADAKAGPPSERLGVRTGDVRTGDERLMRGEDWRCEAGEVPHLG